MGKMNDQERESGPLGSSEAQQSYAKQILLSPAELAERLDETAVIDVSDPADFLKLHIPGACNIAAFWNHRSVGGDSGLELMRQVILDEMLACGIDGSRQIVFTEQLPSSGFGRSCRAFYMAEHAGFPLEIMHILDGGNFQWKQQGFPPAHGKACSNPAPKFVINTGAGRSRFMSLSETLAALKRGAKFLDVRNAPEFLGAAAAPYLLREGTPPREVILDPGRIPGAIGLPWTDVFERQGAGTGCFKSRTELQQLFKSAGLSPGDEIIVYCFKGARSSAVLLALHLAGFYSAKMYFAGWNEWSRQASFPKETGKPEQDQLAGSYAKDTPNET
ncbi:MAG: rhodanese-like domain-containing protein [Syntrophus sp. (in: bacteria)]|nr:rhodanese-like domain-containing protein [Syntrophus sp. (in: bacteria)]